MFYSVIGLLVLSLSFSCNSSSENSSKVSANPTKEVIAEAKNDKSEIKSINSIQESEDLLAQKEEVVSDSQKENVTHEMGNQKVKSKVSLTKNQTDESKDNITKTIQKSPVNEAKSMESKSPEKPQTKTELEKPKVEEVKEKVTAATEVQPTKVVKEEVQKEEIQKEEIQKEETPIFKMDHSILNELLSKYVSASGNVNYNGLSSEKSKLEEYLSLLQNNPIDNSWSTNKKLAYWINAYNGFTIKLILDNYPLSSIMDINGGKPWDKKWIQLNGQTYSLNQIENEIIRPVFKEPRIHFAVNCAAKSCPSLANFAFTENGLNQQLDKMTKAFINSSSNEITSGSAKISKIFEWYAEDFGDLKTYLNKYANVKIAPDTNIEYQEYDWSLNGK